MADEGKLNRWRLFAEIEPEDAEVVMKVCEDRHLVGGEELFRENDPGDALFIVQSGRVDIFKNIRGDVDRSLASFGPGDVIGEMSFIDGARRSATARTTRATRGMTGTEIATTTVPSDGPSAAVITSARTSSGNPCMMSSTGWMMPSTLRPVRPLSSPTAPPPSPPSSAQATPTASETRAPCTSRL